MSVTTKEKFSEAFINSVDLSRYPSAGETRTQAFESFKSIGLPTVKSEEYKFTPITRLLEKFFGENNLVETSPATSTNVDELISSQDQGNRAVFVNGRFDKTLSHIDSNSKVVIKQLADAMQTLSPEVREKLAKVNASNDPFALINSALWLDGLFIHVPKNTTGEKPLTIYQVNDASLGTVVNHTRLLVIVEESAEFTIIEKTNSKGEQPIFNTFTEDFFISENASLEYCKIQNDPGQLIQVNNTTIHQHKASRTNTYTFTLSGKLIRNNLNINIDGEGCESHFYGLYLPTGDSLVDNHTTVDHKKPNSFSNELYKGLMDGKSKGVFNGKIYVRPHAQKTNAFQSNRNILLSDTATINTKPQLEIWADDVKCSHGCTTGQLDDEALFYLQSRGIPKATAKAMLLYAFVGEVIESVKEESLRTYLDSIVSERLHNEF